MPDDPAPAAPDSADPDAAETSEAAAAPAGKWLRVRRSRLVHIDKISQIAIQRRDGDFFLEIQADRVLHLPVPGLEVALEALEAIAAGQMDISEYTIRRDFMKE